MQLCRKFHKINVTDAQTNIRMDEWKGENYIALSIIVGGINTGCPIISDTIFQRNISFIKAYTETIDITF